MHLDRGLALRVGSWTYITEGIICMKLDNIGSSTRLNVIKIVGPPILDLSKGWRESHLNRSDLWSYGKKMIIKLRGTSPLWFPDRESEVVETLKWLYGWYIFIISLHNHAYNQNSVTPPPNNTSEEGGGTFGNEPSDNENMHRRLDDELEISNHNCDNNNRTNPSSLLTSQRGVGVLNLSSLSHFLREMKWKLEKKTGTFIFIFIHGMIMKGMWNRAHHMDNCQ